MSELDLGLKTESRRLLWRMGYSTRVDVPLRSYVPNSTRRGGKTTYETYTDLDVLGIIITPGSGVHSIIADCKTSGRGSTERMFWIRGVADFFDADEAWMVRSKSVTAASRQLSGRLGISVMESTDLKLLETFHPTEVPLDQGPLALLFDETAVSSYMKGYTTLDRKLNKLLEYRQFDYWVYDEHRNLLQLVAHLHEASRCLDPSHPTHRAIFYDFAWLYIHSLAHAISRVRAAHATNITESLQDYIFGGQVALQEKQKLASALRRLAPPNLVDEAGDGVLPHWYPQLLELLTRQLRRPYLTSKQLRYAEWLSEAQVAKESSPLAVAFSTQYDPLAAKLLADVCGFLVTVGNLDSGFRSHARLVMAPPSEGNLESVSDEAGEGAPQGD
ncbi:hypothetical protein [Streptomyces sp. NPDC050560]|uniref:hypothetical protein n=1 Tax=Streptomyces sp. NPDC050560 TaxID=3365630 RepID=UPI0037A1B43A